jgi:hypothetical protein
MQAGCVMVGGGRQPRISILTRAKSKTRITRVSCSNLKQLQYTRSVYAALCHHGQLNSLLYVYDRWSPKVRLRIRPSSSYANDGGQPSHSAPGMNSTRLSQGDDQWQGMQYIDGPSTAERVNASPETRSVVDRQPAGLTAPFCVHIASQSIGQAHNMRSIPLQAVQATVTLSWLIRR